MWRSMAALDCRLLRGGPPACTDSAKVSEEKAVAQAERLAKLADDDVEEVRRGSSSRCQMARARVGRQERSARRSQPRAPRARSRARRQPRSRRRQEHVLRDDRRQREGAAQRSRARHDGRQIAGRVVPWTMSKVLAGETIEMRGSMPETAGARTGGDEQWVAAAPVRDAQGKVRGIYASGWSMRRFAYHLEETLKHDMTSEALRAGDKHVKLPLIYVFVAGGLQGVRRASDAARQQRDTRKARSRGEDERTTPSSIRRSKSPGAASASRPSARLGWAPTSASQCFAPKREATRRWALLLGGFRLLGSAPAPLR